VILVWMDRIADSSAPSAVPGLEKLQSSAQWREIEREFYKTGTAASVERGLSDRIDAIAVETYRASIEPVLPEGAVMLAAGGYGRRETFPYAAVDILVLLEGESPWISLREPLAECVRLLWDAGLRLNHTVRTLPECLEFREQNIDFTINLLDLRFLAGDAALHARFAGKWPAFLEKHGSKLSQHLIQLTRVRHAKYQNTPHHREPDIKECPGGLRDFHLLGSLSHLGPERPQTERPDLADAAAFLSSIRCFLHYQAASDRNLLDLAAQEKLLPQPFMRANSTAELMRQYFQRSWVVFNAARRALASFEKTPSSLAGNFRDWRSRLSNSEFTVSREYLLLRSPAQLDSDPAVVLRLLEFIGRHGIRPAPDTERRLESARGVFAAYCGQPRPMWASIESILALPHAAAAIRALQYTGLLTALFPEMAPIADLVQPASEDRYTADEKTLMALERATELRSTADPTRQRFSQLSSELENRAVLAFALLFHNTGQGSPSGSPVESSVALARQAMERIRVPAEEQREVDFLIEHQLDLADVMSGRDVDDPATARQLAERVGTIERLKLLTILTYSGLAAMSSDAMTPWRLERLWRVYEVTRHELTRELETDRIQEVPGNVPGRPAFLKGFPVRYLRAHSASDIEEHQRLYEESRPTGVAVQLHRIEGAYRLTVIARDIPALFASFAGAISSFGLDILKAEAFSNARGIILDTFVFADPQRTLELNPPESERLLDLIRRVALGKTDGQRLLRDRAQPDPKRRGAPPLVHFDSDACETATLVEIVAEDRPGLLYNLATVFSSTACNIDVVLIDTKGHRAIDVFYVAHDGQKLSPELQAALKEKLLAVC
jgi:[protein-PII] uridylyltransferase